MVACSARGLEGRRPSKIGFFRSLAVTAVAASDLKEDFLGEAGCPLGVSSNPTAPCHIRRPEAIEWSASYSWTTSAVTIPNMP